MPKLQQQKKPHPIKIEKCAQNNVFYLYNEKFQIIQNKFIYDFHLGRSGLPSQKQKFSK